MRITDILTSKLPWSQQPEDTAESYTGDILVTNNPTLIVPSLPEPCPTTPGDLHTPIGDFVLSPCRGRSEINCEK